MNFRLLATALCIATLMTLGASAGDQTTIVVDGGNNDWAFLPEGGTPTGFFSVGPDVPPAGDGSALLQTDEMADGIAIISQELIGTRLDAFTTLSYWTYASSPPQAAALQFSIDYDDTDGDVSWQGRLVFEPLYSGTVLADTWQQWDTLSGEWWASGSPGSGFCTQASRCTWATVLANFPDAAIQGPALGQFLVKSGSGWTGTNTTYTDAIEVVTSGVVDVLYDFEPTTNQVNTSELAENGWFSDDTRADGTATMPEAAGTDLVSPTKTDDPEGSSGAATADHDDDIDNQIHFTLFGPPVAPPFDEWQGAVHLQIAGGVTAGKSQISHRNNPAVTADADGFGFGHEILTGVFQALYSWMGDGTASVTASLKLGFITQEYPGADMSARTGEDAWDKLLIYEPGNGNGATSDGTWHNEAINFNSGSWWIVDRAGVADGNTIGSPMPLANMMGSGVAIGGRTVAAVWALLTDADPGEEAILTSIQLGIGSSNAGGSVYVNQLETSFYRKGMITTFGTDPAASAVICVPSSFDAQCEGVEPTIQDALDTTNLGPEDIILVDSGTFNESPIVGTGVMLRGANAGSTGCNRVATETIITGEIRVDATDVLIDGFSFESASSKLRAGAIIDNLVVRNNRFVGSDEQVLLSFDGDDVTFEDNEFVGLAARSSISGHMRMGASLPGLYVRRNCFTDSGLAGVAFDGGSTAPSTVRSPVFSDNLFDSTAGGLDFSYGSASLAEFSGNTFLSLTDHGIQGQLIDSLVVDNLFSGGVGGILFSEDEGGTPPGNASTGNSALLNCFYQNQGSALEFSATLAAGAIATNDARFNDLVDNVTGASYTGAETIDVTSNFWGTADGPSGDGPGSGDPVAGAGLDFSPFASAPFTFSTPCHPVADLSISKVDDVADAQAVISQTVVYTITVDNLGPFDATNAQVLDPIPSGLGSCSWTCQGTGGAACGAASGENSISDVVDIPVGDAVTYELTCTFDPDPDGFPVTNVAFVDAGDQTDSNPANDSAAERTATEEIFADGFESGDTTAWSDTFN